MYLRHAAAVPEVFVIVAVVDATLALIAQRARDVILMLVIGNDHAALAGGHHLGGEEGKGAAIGQIAGHLAAEDAAVSVRCVFQHKHAAIMAESDRFGELSSDDAGNVYPHHSRD